ncbi:MAG: hypothetical protein ACRED6_06025, partial [Stellaceae bacterium]
MGHVGNGQDGGRQKGQEHISAGRFFEGAKRIERAAAVGRTGRLPFLLRSAEHQLGRFLGRDIDPNAVRFEGDSLEIGTSEVQPRRDAGEDEFAISVGRGPVDRNSSRIFQDDFAMEVFRAPRRSGRIGRELDPAEDVLARRIQGPGLGGLDSSPAMDTKAGGGGANERRELGIGLSGKRPRKGGCEHQGRLGRAR